MFVEITRRNTKGEDKVNLVNTDRITAILETTQEEQNLYDENGDLVETRKPTERLFVVLIDNRTCLTITEKSYNELVKKLTK